MSKPEKRILSIDFLRVIFILLILFAHLPAYLDNNHFENRFYNFIADLGLSGFIIISGFGLSYRHFKTKKLDFFPFIKERFLRIYPLYYLALFIFLILKISSIKNSLTLISHLLGLQILFYSSTPPIITLWFIGIIVLYYLSFIFLIKKADKSDLNLLIAVMVVFVLSFILHQLVNILEYRYFLYFIPFIFGLFIGKHFIYLKKVFLGKMFLTFLLVFLIGLFFSQKISLLSDLKLNLLSFSISIYPIIFLFLNNLVGIAFFIILFSAFFSLEKQKVKFITSFSSLGSACYCTYLFHRPIWTLMLKLFHPSDPLIKGIFLVILGIPIIFILSNLIQSRYTILTRFCSNLLRKNRLE